MNFLNQKDVLPKQEFCEKINDVNNKVYGTCGSQGML